MKAKAYPLRAHLFCIIGVMLIPALMLTGFVLRDLYHTGVSQVERDAREISRRLSAVVDREVVSITLALQVLSTSRLFTERRFEDLQKQALEIKDIVKADIIIKDATGQQLVNTRLAWGSPLPISLPEADQLALEKLVPTISDVFTGATSRSPIVSINVPIIRGGKVHGLVNTGLDPARLSALLAAGGFGGRAAGSRRCFAGNAQRTLVPCVVTPRSAGRSRRPRIFSKNWFAEHRARMAQPGQVARDY